MGTDQVRDFLLALNDCWQSSDLSGLPDFYHTDVVLLPPDMGEPIRGRVAVVDSYREFRQAATLKDFQVTGLEVFDFPFNDAADGSGFASYMAHLTFTVAYTLEGDDYVETGMEVYALAEAEGALKIIWRHQSVLDSRLAEKV